MDELFKSASFWTVVISLTGTIISYVVIINTVKQKIDFLDREFVRLEKQHEAHQQEIKAKDITMWNVVNDIKNVMNEVIKSLTRVETKLEYHNKGDNS